MTTKAAATLSYTSSHVDYEHDEIMVSDAISPMLTFRTTNAFISLIYFYTFGLFGDKA